MSSQIEVLSESIATDVREIASHLRSNSLPFPGFGEDSPVNPAIDNVRAEKARIDALSSCLELFDLLQGPQMCLRPCLNGAPLQIIYRFRLAQLVPLQGMISFKDLAHECGILESDLRQVIRFAIVYHRCFQEPEKGMISHSAASKQLRESHDVQSGLGYMFDGNYQSFGRLCSALEQQKGQPKDISKTGWSLATGSDQSFFDDLQADAAMADRFQGALRFFTATVPGHSPQLLAENYPWRDLAPGSVVVDVGGGDGSIARVIADLCPATKFVVQDQSRVIEVARQATDIPSNIEFQVHDFFEPQPIHGAQVYLLRWILHDWPDNYAIRILKALIPGLQHGASVVINDYVGPGQAGKLPLLAERFVREMDMVMLANHNTYEREVEDWNRIVAEADSRFGPVKITFLPQTMMAILVLHWDVN